MNRPDVRDHPARVLIVDDDSHNRELLEVMLEPEGYVLLTASTGEEALQMVATESPDVVLLDVMMPGMDGYQVTTAIKGDYATKNIPVILVTALNDRAARIRGLSLGAEDFLSKPVDRAELCVRVRNLLRLKAYGDYHDQYSKMLEDEVGSRDADIVESERLYRSTFDAAPVGIAHVALTGAWLRVNQRLCDLLGYPCDELTSAAVQTLMQAEDTAGEVESFREMVAGRLDHHVVDDKRFRRRDGGFIWARENMSVHRGADGRPQHIILVIEDITERRALEAQVRQANKMEAIGQLASGVAHDFNNLLTVILGFTELVTEDASIVQRHGKDLDEIIKAAQRAAGLTKQLLAFGRQQLLHAAPLDVNELITNMTSMLGRLIGEHIQVTLDLAADPPMAFADRGQVEQVVMNLVVNARDAMPEGGRLTIATTDVELEDTSFDDEEVAGGRYVLLDIRDTGSGMTEETQRRMFEPFFTTKEIGKGTGLGLATIYGIVRQSKGYIRVSSEPGRGTTFTVYLPVAKISSGDTRDAVETAPSYQARGRG
jgi:PAS domain S-box-containing protein